MVRRLQFVGALDCLALCQARVLQLYHEHRLEVAFQQLLEMHSQLTPQTDVGKSFVCFLRFDRSIFFEQLLHKLLLELAFHSCSGHIVTAAEQLKKLVLVWRFFFV